MPIIRRKLVWQGHKLAMVTIHLIVGGLSMSTAAQNTCGKAPTAPKWMTNAKHFAPHKQKAVNTFLKKADRYIECQDRVNRSALQRLTPQQQRARLKSLSQTSHSRNALQRRLNQSLAKQRSKNPF